MGKRILIIGGVAGGATAAARARRLDEEAEITVLERGPYVSYANCGLPYFIARDIEKRSQLLLQTPEGFDARYGVKVKVKTEALELDRKGKRVRILGPKGEEWLSYDKLILAQGGNPVKPPLPGVDAPHVFQLWTVPDTDRIHGFLDTEKPRTAVVVGGGFIGLEMAEALRRRGLEVTVVELLPTVMAVMDAELGHRVQGELEANGVKVVTGVGVKAVHPAEKTLELTDGRRLPAEVVLLSVGVRPELALARAAGLEIGPTGALLVNDRLETSDPDVLAAGDMVEVVHKISGKRARIPLAGPANRQGRIAATNALGGDLRYHGALGTSVVKVFEATAGMTGLSERAAREAGLDVGVAVIHKDHHAGYYPGAKELLLKVVYDRKTAKLLGGQAFGHAGADKRVDVLATALQGGMTLHDLEELDLAYAPPYSSANDPVNLVAMVGLNDVKGHAPLMTAGQLKAALDGPNPPLVLDVRNGTEYERGHVAGARNVPVDELRWELESLPRDRKIAVVCKSGFRAHLALRILKGKGFADVVNVTGGMTSVLAEGVHTIQTGD
ncbi:MAG: FAD-dependent oxidoreductase [Anaeromyxobacter sp.]